MRAGRLCLLTERGVDTEMDEISPGSPFEVISRNSWIAVLVYVSLGRSFKFAALFQPG